MFLLFVEYLPADALIPLPDGKKCPKDTQYKENKVGRDLVKTCSCEEHCAWDLCRLVNPPNKCLRGTRSQWQWDSFKNAWVAQVIEGNKFYSKKWPSPRFARKEPDELLVYFMEWSEIGKRNF